MLLLMLIMCSCWWIVCEHQLSLLSLHWLSSYIYKEPSSITNGRGNFDIESESTRFTHISIRRGSS